MNLNEYQSNFPLSFAKIHGLGNNFIIIAVQKDLLSFFTTEKIIDICSNHIGVGADGLILIHPDNSVTMYNPDGSFMGMCGNGIRCVTGFISRILNSKAQQHKFNVEGREIVCKIVEINSPYSSIVEVEMGAPEILNDIHLSVFNFDCTPVLIPNPHAIIFVNERLEKEFFLNIGSKIENDSNFPNRTNVEFVKVESSSKIQVDVWERGAGATLACGTGACASVCASYLKGYIGKHCTVSLPGGELKIELVIDDNNQIKQVLMTGPEEQIFTGVIRL